MVSLKHRAMEWLVKGNPGEHVPATVVMPVTCVEEKGLLRDYPILNIPEARRALRQVGQFVRGESVEVSR